MARSALLRAVENFPEELLSRICPAERAIMLLATSARVRGLLTRMQRRLPAVVSMVPTDSPQWNRIRWRCWFAGAADWNQLPINSLASELPRLQTRCSVVRIDLSSRGIKAQGAGRLARVLGQCSSLAELILCDNGIGAEGSCSLAQVLGQCSSLTKLDLSKNGIGGEGVKSLAEVLGQCSSLAKLNLGNNNIGSEGARSLAQELGQCSSLADLNLEVNDIGDEGAWSLGVVLGQCSSLHGYIFVRMQSQQKGRKSWRGCWGSAPRWPSWILQARLMMFQAGA